MTITGLRSASIDSLYRGVPAVEIDARHDHNPPEGTGHEAVIFSVEEVPNGAKETQIAG